MVIAERPKSALCKFDLLAQLLDPNEPKTEREHAAVREIARLLAEIDNIKQVEFPRRVEKVADGWRNKSDRAEAEIARLRDENARLRAERDDADRRAGAAEREQERDREAAYARDSWIRKAKAQWGVGNNVSFDVVWAEALAMKAAAMRKGE